MLDFFFWQGEIDGFGKDLVVGETGEIDRHGVVVDEGDVGFWCWGRDGEGVVEVDELGMEGVGGGVEGAVLFMRRLFVFDSSVKLMLVVVQIEWGEGKWRTFDAALRV
jgi:hypothetical protein